MHIERILLSTEANVCTLLVSPLFSGSFSKAIPSNNGFETSPKQNLHLSGKPTMAIISESDIGGILYTRTDGWARLVGL